MFLLNAAKARVGAASRWLKPRETTALCDRSTGKQIVEVFHATLRMKPLFEGIMQLPGVNPGVIMP